MVEYQQRGDVAIGRQIAIAGKLVLECRQPDCLWRDGGFRADRFAQHHIGETLYVDAPACDVKSAPAFVDGKSMIDDLVSQLPHDSSVGNCRFTAQEHAWN